MMLLFITTPMVARVAGSPPFEGRGYGTRNRARPRAGTSTLSRSFGPRSSRISWDAGGSLSSRQYISFLFLY